MLYMYVNNIKILEIMLPCYSLPGFACHRDDTKEMDTDTEIGLDEIE